MTIKDLIIELEKYPKGLIVWVSDGGYIEGAVPLQTISKQLAYSADLDGDAVNNEYEYIKKEDIINYADTHKIIDLEDGEFVASKYILMIE